MSDQPSSIVYQIFSADFDTPIDFEGDVTTSTDGESATVVYEGKASLGTPFNVTVDPLVMTVTTDSEAEVSTEVTFGFPNGISDLLVEYVKPKLSDAFWQVIEVSAMPVLKLWESSEITISTNPGEDENVQWGFNCEADTLLSAFEPLTSLNQLFPVLGLDKITLVLSLGTSDLETFSLGASLELNVAMGTQAVIFQTLSVDFTQDTLDSTLGVAARLQLNLDKDQLEIVGGVEGTVGENADLVIYGYLDGDWVSPFGVKGLTITEMGGQVGTSELPPYITLGIRGGIDIDGVIQGDVAVLLDTTSPILDIYSEPGLSLTRFIKALTSVDSGNLLDVTIKDLQIYVAPDGGSIAGKEYDPGFSCGGAFDLWGFEAAVEGSLEYSNDDVYSTGGSLSGSVDKIVLTGLDTTIIKITSEDGDSGAAIELVFEENLVSNVVTGRIYLMDGIVNQAINEEFTADGFTLGISENATIYSKASVGLSGETFTINSNYMIGVSVDVSGIKVNMNVECIFSVTVNQSSAGQKITFKFDALGVKDTEGPYGWSIAFKDVADLTQAYYDLVADTFNDLFVNTLAAAGEEAFEWVKDNVTDSYEEAAALFMAAGADASQVAEELVDVFGATPEEAVTVVTDSAEEAVEILENTFNYTVDQAGDYLNDLGTMTDEQISETLKAAGYAANEVDDWISNTLPYL